MGVPLSHEEHAACEDFQRKLAYLKAAAGIGPTRLATMVGFKSHTSVWQIADGKNRVPPELADYVNRLYAWHKANPPPRMAGA